MVFNTTSKVFLFRGFMKSFVLSCCSTADLTKEQMNQYGINYVCFHYELDGKQYLDDLGQSMDFEDFYRTMSEGAETKTSQVNADEFAEYFRPFLAEGQDILHVCLSSGLSGVYNSAMIAREDLMEEFPDRKIYVVDGLGASGGYGLMMMTLATMADNGATIKEAYDWIEENKLKMNHWFFSTDLSFYVKGGRISKTSGFVGNLLNICPLLNMDNEGHLVPRFKIRTKKRVKESILEKMVENARDGVNYNGKCLITHSGCKEDAMDVASMVKETFPSLDGEVDVNYIGTTIGSHTGPGTVALFFWGNERVD